MRFKRARLYDAGRSRGTLPSLSWSGGDPLWWTVMQSREWRSSRAAVGGRGAGIALRVATDAQWSVKWAGLVGRTMEWGWGPGDENNQEETSAHYHPPGPIW